MEFGLSDEQVMFRDSVAGTLKTIATISELRAVVNANMPHSDKAWSGLIELGATSVLVPEAHGGLGLGIFEAAILHEEVGRVLAPVPLLGAAASAIAISTAATLAQQAEWFPRLATGVVRVALAVGGQIANRGEGALRAGDGRLSGRALFAIDTASATHVLVADRTGALYFVGLDAPGLKVEVLSTLDRTRGFAAIGFDQTPAELLPHGKAGVVINATRVLLAAEILGAAQVMLTRSIAYSAERTQFGRFIGSFQAVKHMCAEMAAKLEPCHALVWYAAHAQDVRPAEAMRMAGHAKSHLSDVGRFVARTATEVHGGIGLTEALGLEYWFKRIETNRQLLGSPEIVRAEIAADQGWGSRSL